MHVSHTGARRRFDHLLGFLKAQHPELDGLNGDETNPYDPQNPAAGTVTVSADSGYVTDPDPGVRVRGVRTAGRTRPVTSLSDP